MIEIQIKKEKRVLYIYLFKYDYSHKIFDNNMNKFAVKITTII